MSIGTMTSKGQITIPKDVREQLGLSPGTRVSFSRNGAGEVVLTREVKPISALVGALRRGRAAVSLDDMAEAIAGGAAGVDG